MNEGVRSFPKLAGADVNSGAGCGCWRLIHSLDTIVTDTELAIRESEPLSCNGNIWLYPTSAFFASPFDG
jgi:hypothetical protein